MRQLIIAGLSLAAACFFSPADARVQRIEIVSRQAFAAGTEFGHAGAYEKLRGRAFFALDPDTAANGPIADLKLAPRNDRGLVEFSAEFLVCDPPTSLAATARFCTRSTTAAISPFSVSCTKRPPTMIRPPQRMPATVFCFDWALPWCGRRGLLRPPIATKDGTPITGKVAYELTVDAPRPTADSPACSAPHIRLQARGRLMRC